MTERLKFFIFISLFIALSLKYSHIARTYINDMTNFTINKYLNTTSYTKSSIASHLDQKKQIELLKNENTELKNIRLKSLTYKNELNSLLRLHKQKDFHPKIELVKSLSYENISNYDRVWIQMNDFNTSKIYGLIYNSSTAGIVISKNNRPLGLLQGDKKCIFSVKVGKDKLPGVAMGRGKDIHVKYIPLWMQPKVGDIVKTSGLDNIFTKGILVGKVIKVIKEESYQTAIVRPNVKVNTPEFFYIIKG